LAHAHAHAHALSLCPFPFGPFPFGLLVPALHSFTAVHYDRCDIDAIHYNGNHKLPTARLAAPHLVKGVSGLWAGHDFGWDAFRSAHGKMAVLPRDVSSAVRAQFGHATLRDLLPVCCPGSDAVLPWICLRAALVLSGSNVPTPTSR